MLSESHGISGSKLLRLAGEKPVSACNALSAAFLMLILVLTTADVLGRYAFNSPIRGKTELTQLMMAMTVGFALPGAILRGHSIVVDLLDTYFNPKIAIVRDCASNAICSASMFVISYWIYFLGVRQMRWGNVTAFLNIPVYPFTYIICFLVAIGGMMFLLRIGFDVANYLRSLSTEVESE